MSKITRNIKVPTGNICIMKGEKGLLEFLSIGDYGKEANIKADFLGLNREINGVPNAEILPLEEKWVLTLSTQYGCSMGYTFCSPAGTMVNTPHGKKPIEELNKGDLVIGFNFKTDSIQVQEIEELVNRKHTGEIIKIELENGNILQVTPNHEIYTENRGWVEAGNLTELDILKQL